MARVQISEFGVIQKVIAGATVQFFVADDNGENTGVAAVVYKAATGSDRVNNPQVLDEDGKLSVECWIDNMVMAEISNISDLANRSLSKLKANPLQFPLGATNAAWQGASVEENISGAVDDAQTAATQSQDYLLRIEEVFSGADSTSSVVVGTGTKTFTVDAGLPITVGQYMIAISTVNPTTHKMTGQVTSYSGTTLTIDMEYSLGSGTRTAWKIAPSGPRGAQGVQGPSGPGTGDMLKSENLGGLASVPAARTNLGLLDGATTSVAEIRRIPQNSKSADYTLVIGDAGGHIYHPDGDTANRTFTIPANASVAFPVSTAISFVNRDVDNNVTIAINSDTLTFAGTGATGSRTLAPYGMATALKISATEWIISGVGLS